MNYKAKPVFLMVDPIENENKIPHFFLLNHFPTSPFPFLFPDLKSQNHLLV